MRGDKGMNMAGAMAVVAGRAARPCDVCGRKRARWYCAADEAYLCEACDSSVHAANALALRHERVRLAPNGAPMKMDRRNINNYGESLHATAIGAPKRKLKSRPSDTPHSTPDPAFLAPHRKSQNLVDPSSTTGNQLREVKTELNHSGCTDGIEPSDDHFTAEELTGNANLLDDSPSPSECNHTMIPETDFAHNFLVSDPNDCNNSYSCSNHNNGRGTTSSAGAGGGDVVDEDEEDDDQDGVGTGWMELHLGHRDLSDDEEYCLDLAELHESVSAAGADDDHSGSAYGFANQHESNDDKPSIGGSCERLSSSKAGKPFKNIAGQSVWVKMEEGTHANMQQDLATCKSEGQINCDLRQVPSLRLDYADVLSSWSDRSMRWTDGLGTGNPRLVPDDSNSDAMGSCYDLGLVPDLSSAGCGASGVGHVAAMYGGSSTGVCTGASEDSSVNASNAREARVIRYREKRRTRLFSKKIRYEVRKLNAERRPRMKGRFVKRSPGRD